MRQVNGVEKLLERTISIRREEDSAIQVGRIEEQCGEY